LFKRIFINAIKN